MHNLGDSFGFRRSYEDFWSGAEGGYKLPLDPAGGNVLSNLLQGDLVTVDLTTTTVSPTMNGALKKAPADTVLVPGFTGLVVQYDQLFISAGLTRPVIFQTRDLSQLIPNTYAVIATGAGLKVWVRNLPAVTGPNRRNYPAETRCALTGESGAVAAPGALVAWDGAKYVPTTNEAHAIGTITGEVYTTAGGEGFTFVLNA